MATPVDAEIADIAARLPVIQKLEQDEATALARLADVRARLQEQRTVVTQRLAEIRGKLR